MPGRKPPTLLSRREVLATSAAALLFARRAEAVGLWPARVPTGVSLVAADQNEELQTKLIASGEQAKLASQVTYANFLGGPAILEAFRAGALDVALVGNTPPIQAQAAGEKILIIGARLSSDVDYRLAVRPGLTVTRFEDLKGLRITYGEGTGRQPYILNALKAAGLSRRDVTLIPLRAADFPDAVRSGQVDVAVLNEPHYSRYLADYADRGVKPLPESEYTRLPRGLSYLYAAEKSLADPAKTAALADFTAHWIAAERWSVMQAEAWVQAYFVKRQRLKPEDGRKIAASVGQLSFPRLASLIETQQKLADVIFEAHDLPRRLDAALEFDLRFDAVIAANG